ncbi:hypothetical protein [Pantoea piersonii]|uniref:hypothetical protein n=2 Tax=Pantoea TaxID=53335 RepID=UPI0028A12DB1|nr:hypothetical protein [Pantoea piersonii]
MAALLIIPLLISGYIVLTKHPYHFYRLHRYDGQLLYMKAAVYGFFCLMFAVFVAVLAKWAFSSFHPVTALDKMTAFTKEQSNNRMYSWVILLSITSLAIGYIWGYVAKAIYLIRFIRKALSGSYPSDIKTLMTYLRLSILEPLFSELPINKIFFESMVSKRHILVSLKCGKVYVGVINKISEPNESDAPNQEISIVPVMSGYRHKDTRRVTFTNDYGNLVDVDTSVRIPCSEVSHTSWFERDIHTKIDNNAIAANADQLAEASE